MSLDKIKAKLEALKQQQAQSTGGGGKSNDLIWKPSPGKQVVRLLPNPHTDAGYPFVELLFYYDFGKTWVSPTCFDLPDPVVEYCNHITDGQKLEKEEFKNKMALKRKLLPKDRIYVPIIVRGTGDAPDEVKYWGFGKQIFTELLTTMDDDDYGDISDIRSGRDLTIEYTPAPSATEFPKTNIRVKPNISVATEDQSVIEKIKALPDLKLHFTCPTYNELKDALEAYFKIPAKEAPAKTAPSSDSNPYKTINHDATNEGFEIEKKPRVKEPAADVDDIMKQFDELIGK